MHKIVLNSTKIAALIISSTISLNNAACDELRDKEITSEVQNILKKESDIPVNHLKIKTNNGIVSLEGKVDTRLQADRIIELVNTINEVKEVDAYKLKTVRSNQYMKDAFITATIKGKIILLTQNGHLSKNSLFHIETTNGYVHISGRADNKKEVDNLIKTIYSIKGVKEVKHSIDISRN